MLIRPTSKTTLVFLLNAMVWLGLASCKNKQQSGDSLFTLLDSSVTGIHFANRLMPTPAFNLFSYMYYYNGAGVGAGDFNND